MDHGVEWQFSTQPQRLRDLMDFALCLNAGLNQGRGRFSNFPFVYTYKHLWGFLTGSALKNLPAMPETQVRSLVELKGKGEGGGKERKRPLNKTLGGFLSLLSQ